MSNGHSIEELWSEYVRMTIGNYGLTEAQINNHRTTFICAASAVLREIDNMIDGPTDINDVQERLDELGEETLAMFDDLPWGEASSGKRCHRVRADDPCAVDHDLRRCDRRSDGNTR